MWLPQKQIYTESGHYALPEDVGAELIDNQIYCQATPSGSHQTVLEKTYQSIANDIDTKGGSCEVYPAPLAVKLYEV